MDYSTKCIPETAGQVPMDAALLASLVQASPAVMYSCKVSEDYGTIAVTENVRAVLGYLPEEFIADPGFWAVRVHPEDSARVFEQMPRLFREGKEIVEYRFRHADGSYIWLRDHMTLKPGTGGPPARILGCWLQIDPSARATFIPEIVGNSNTKTTTILGGKRYAYQT